MSDCRIVRTQFGRWIIQANKDPGLAWSGSRWVKHKFGMPVDVQISNFADEFEAFHSVADQGLEPATFVIRNLGSEPSITCLLCRMTSYNVNDIRQRYCGFCQEFHDDYRPI